MIAAIGTDGLDLVVWGVGETEDEAQADAEHWIDVDLDTPIELEYVEITEAQAAMISDGVTLARNLGIVWE